MTAYGGNTYAYDANGDRIGKTVNGVETRFITASGKVIRSITNGVVTDFFTTRADLRAYGMTAWIT